jgi:hypothetical protein
MYVRSNLLHAQPGLMRLQRSYTISSQRLDQVKAKKKNALRPSDVRMHGMVMHIAGNTANHNACSTDALSSEVRDMGRPLSENRGSIRFCSRIMTGSSQSPDVIQRGCV